MLFVGGHYDGEWLTVDNVVEQIKLPIEPVEQETATPVTSHNINFFLDLLNSPIAGAPASILGNPYPQVNSSGVVSATSYNEATYELVTITRRAGAKAVEYYCSADITLEDSIELLLAGYIGTNDDD